MRNLLLASGVLALAIGLLWIGQGTGVVKWPASSFMISQTQWAWYGVALAVVGLALIWRGRAGKSGCHCRPAKRGPASGYAKPASRKLTSWYVLRRRRMPNGRYR